MQLRIFSPRIRESDLDSFSCIGNPTSTIQYITQTRLCCVEQESYRRGRLQTVGVAACAGSQGCHQSAFHQRTGTRRGGHRPRRSLQRSVVLTCISSVVNICVCNVYILQGRTFARYFRRLDKKKNLILEVILLKMKEHLKFTYNTRNQLTPR